MNRKGQAAMEFLMTYGWAILVVLIAIGALSYFGVLTPQISDSALFPAPITNIGQPVLDADTNTIEVAFKNGVGSTINVTVDNASITPEKGTCTFTAGTLQIDDANANKQITVGSNFRVKWTCTNDVTSGETFKANAMFKYTNTETGLTLKQQGTVQGTWK